MITDAAAASTVVDFDSLEDAHSASSAEDDLVQHPGEPPLFSADFDALPYQADDLWQQRCRLKGLSQAVSRSKAYKEAHAVELAQCKADFKEQREDYKRRLSEYNMQLAEYMETHSRSVKPKEWYEPAPLGSTAEGRRISAGVGPYPANMDNPYERWRGADDDPREQHTLVQVAFDAAAEGKLRLAPGPPSDDGFLNTGPGAGEVQRRLAELPANVGVFDVAPLVRRAAEGYVAAKYGNDGAADHSAEVNRVARLMSASAYCGAALYSLDRAAAAHDSWADGAFDFGKAFYVGSLSHDVDNTGCLKANMKQFDAVLVDYEKVS